MQTYRALTFSEASFVRPTSREVIGTSFELRGTVDSTALRAAYGALLEEYPVLSARIVTLGGKPHFAPGDPAVASAIGFQDVAAPWTGYDQTPPWFVGSEQLSAITLTGLGESYRLTLWASHAATDGSGIVAIATRLFELYTAFASGATPIVRTARDFPSEPHLVMAARGHTPGELDYEERLAGTSWHGAVPAPAEPAAPQTPDSDDAIRVRFDTAATAALAATARAHGFSAHALVSGLIARAELAESDDDAALALLTPVDFRGRIDPPIPLRSVTALCGFSYVAVRDDAVEAIARIVADTIRSDVRDGTVLRTAVSPMPDLATRRHGPPVLISNLGEFPALTVPGSLEVLDFHSQIVRSAAGIREYAATWQGDGAPPAPIGSSYLISTFGGRLSIEMRVLPGTLGAEARTRILSRIEAGAHALLEVGTAA
ncbi:Phthiocerol/phthiodiolone dimycocerosyl transferase OS=Tsukamurella paurometabola (strain ATCC 8368/ DSM / CCUG 35730 / CIP 100753 / JCM 10117 / KCTC 9821/ NBRC 16120 / NCIMB 702349 / NCTC 13040) OX=521096 GN=Tpau_1039 PE=3 SV=1 [Tsukamurella paurometabola]|uniref:Phthiocerol/phthiodiolone dimycocerosyl transferase n=1 Tax=Tsukamurella paurometabola (strain ATCC 8368 / DSM 20162 / CCUG 35730 / CIP 100753 / JCM 10117 / KCTC 9821 / NBRC 16120 / NCIMB 702349 / NCTC 13040) TaxID=521096 RepID=D5UV82_TSUPD|nr:acyltransferase [Tsukamurella paurometabola]ADG77672.1 acyltransferase PapA5 [Tsukamurella paurometabola DSM 20162]SUP28231.1 Phthiocerol/phthiodiolone dimycocerosyl transferase [Tsukamurella paurometabola]